MAHRAPNKFRRCVMSVLDRHAPKKCGCCGGPGVVKVGARWYCEATARILTSPSAEALL